MNTTMYHLNMQGEPRQCNADWSRNGCRLASFEEHYLTEEEAKETFEGIMNFALFPAPVSKKERREVRAGRTRVEAPKPAPSVVKEEPVKPVPAPSVVEEPQDHFDKVLADLL